MDESCMECGDTRAPFTEQELLIIQAGCLTANPWYPARPMMKPWASIYSKAERALAALLEREAWEALHAACKDVRGCVAPLDADCCK